MQNNASNSNPARGPHTLPRQRWKNVNANNAPRFVGPRPNLPDRPGNDAPRTPRVPVAGPFYIGSRPWKLTRKRHTELHKLTCKNCAVTFFHIHRTPYCDLHGKCECADRRHFVNVVAEKKEEE